MNDLLEMAFWWGCIGLVLRTGCCSGLALFKRGIFIVFFGTALEEITKRRFSFGVCPLFWSVGDDGAHLEGFRRLGFIDAPYHEEPNPKGHPSLEAVLFPHSYTCPNDSSPSQSDSTAMYLRCTYLCCTSVGADITRPVLYVNGKRMACPTWELAARQRTWWCIVEHLVP